VARTTQEYLGPYRLLNLLRTGKTCQVWEAMNDLKGGRFALKVLLAEYRHNRDEVALLQHEHHVGCKLKHPRVITIYEYGIDHDNVYLGMELYQAPNIKQVINQGVEVLAPILGKVIEQAAEGLAYFHSQGWVHRDIKPDNYLMNPAGEVKLIDFALAQPLRGGFLSRLMPRSKKIQGTRSYMSPEQIRSQRLDERADIYSFGCMAHELVGGKPPFTGPSTNDLLNKHLSAGPPPLQASNRNVTDAFAQLVRRMLSKNPKDRPATMDVVLRELRGMSVLK
jgi:eukaryotic-like serine/threonine-protein kinase